MAKIGATVEPVHRSGRLRALAIDGQRECKARTSVKHDTLFAPIF
jgi:hypothetical protein